MDADGVNDGADDDVDDEVDDLEGSADVGSCVGLSVEVSYGVGSSATSIAAEPGVVAAVTKVRSAVELGVGAVSVLRVGDGESEESDFPVGSPSYVPVEEIAVMVLVWKVLDGGGSSF